MSKLRPSVNGSPDDVVFVVEPNDMPELEELEETVDEACERIAEAIAKGLQAQDDKTEDGPRITLAPGMETA